MRHFKALGFVLFTALTPVSLIGCAADSEDAAGGGDAVTAASPASALFAEAETLSVQHFAANACQSGEHATTSAIVAKLVEATHVDPSPAFRAKIARSAKIKKAIGQTLEFGMFSGTITVDGARVLGIAQSAAAHSIEVYGPPEDGQGTVTKLELDADGQGKLWNLSTDGANEWSSEAIQYRVLEDADGTHLFINTMRGSRIVDVSYKPYTASSAEGEGFAINGDDPADGLTFTSHPDDVCDDS